MYSRGFQKINMCSPELHFVILFEEQCFTDISLTSNDHPNKIDSGNQIIAINNNTIHPGSLTPFDQ